MKKGSCELLMTSENKTNAVPQTQTQRQKNLPIVKKEDVEFSYEAADNEDMAAQSRAAAANNRINTTTASNATNATNATNK
jgi:hypothetical protein